MSETCPSSDTPLCAAPFAAFCLAAPRSGEGKTTVAMALGAALVLRHQRVQVFKCGPDYIDPTFHAAASGRAVYNVDSYMMREGGVRYQWAAHTQDADVALCEGAMGLFDARRVDALEGSSADIARILQVPVILVVNVRGMAGSLAALVRGFTDEAKACGVRIAGVIGNKSGSARHTALLQDALHRAGLPPFLGALPRNGEWELPERQLGLVPEAESACTANMLDALAVAAEEYIDLDSLLALCACERPKLAVQNFSPAIKRMAVARDTAFTFYYEANLQALQSAGWRLVPFSPLHDAQLPPNVDAVYLGGGYPELFARELAANRSMLDSLRAFAANAVNEKSGENSEKRIFAECGGYMYLCNKLIDANGEEHELCGLVDGTAHMGKRLRTLGYRDMRLAADTPFASANTPLRGHEFHWSSITLNREYPPLFSSCTGTFGNGDMGVAYGAVRASYIHTYWAHTENFDQK